MSSKIRLVMVASEIALFAKTGGLADVMGSLPIALAKTGAFDIRLFMPRYRGVSAKQATLAENVTVHFIEHEGYFNRSSLYGNARGDYEDNLERFTFFCYEVLKQCQDLGFKPDALWCHDWQAALIPVLLKTRFMHDKFFEKTKSILTIHNLAYQGNFPRSKYDVLGLDESYFGVDGFEFYGKICLLKAGIAFADYVTTVSPTYAKEIQTPEYGCGLDGVVRSRKSALCGILNGIDEASWSPETDTNLAANFSADSWAPKKECKRKLQEFLQLEQKDSIPLFAIVSRLAHQKGLDFLAEIADEFLSLPVQFVLLGQGEAQYETTFRNIQARHPHKARALIEFDEKISRKIYSACDFFVMPSIFEPCGLGQLIAFRYGAVPVVRATGGLVDTVQDLHASPSSGNGFVFHEKNSNALLKSLKLALQLFKEHHRFEEVSKKNMRLDFSWNHSAAQYRAFLRSVTGL